MALGASVLRNLAFAACLLTATARVSVVLASASDAQGGMANPSVTPAASLPASPPVVLVCGFDSPGAFSPTEIAVPCGNGSDGDAATATVFDFPLQHVTSLQLLERLRNPSTVAAIVVSSPEWLAMAADERTRVLASSLTGMLVFVADADQDEGSEIGGSSASGTDSMLQSGYGGSSGSGTNTPSSVAFLGGAGLNDAVLWVQARLGGMLALVDADYSKTAQSVETAPLGGTSNKIIYAKIEPPITQAGFITAYLRAVEDKRIRKNGAIGAYSLARELLTGVFTDAGEAGMSSVEAEMDRRFAVVKARIRQTEAARTLLSMAMAICAVALLYAAYSFAGGAVESGDQRLQAEGGDASSRRARIRNAAMLAALAIICAASSIVSLGYSAPQGERTAVTIMRQDALLGVALSRNESYELAGGRGANRDAGFLEYARTSAINASRVLVPVELVASELADGGCTIELTNKTTYGFENAKVVYRGFVFYVGRVAPNASVRMNVPNPHGSQGYEDAFAAADPADAVFSLIRRIEKRRFGENSILPAVELATGALDASASRADDERSAALSCGYELLFELARRDAPCLTATLETERGTVTLEHIGKVAPIGG